MPVTRAQLRRERERHSPSSYSATTPPPPLTLFPSRTAARRSPHPALRRRASRKRSPSLPAPRPRIATPPSPSTYPSPFHVPPQETTYGLIQERLPPHAYPLLIQAILWNQTTGRAARPILVDLLARYPTPAHLARAPRADLVELLQPIGLHNIRAERLGAFARRWLEAPPCVERRYRRHNYPGKGDGGDVRPGEVLGLEDERVGWEVAHLPGVGAYALDSWRIFGRDELRGLAGRGGRGKGKAKEEVGEKGVVELGEKIMADQDSVIEVKVERGEEVKMTPGKVAEVEGAEEDEDDGDPGEWRLVVPGDKELRKYLVWRWRRCGWVWDPMTGKRRRLRRDEEQCDGDIH